MGGRKDVAQGILANMDFLLVSLPNKYLFSTYYQQALCDVVRTQPAGQVMRCWLTLWTEPCSLLLSPVSASTIYSDGW